MKWLRRAHLLIGVVDLVNGSDLEEDMCVLGVFPDAITELVFQHTYTHSSLKEWLCGGGTFGPGGTASSNIPTPPLVEPSIR